jgi:RND family efflux transporter MFP subunit
MSSANPEKPRDSLASLRIARPTERRRASLLGRLFKFVVVLAILAGLGVGGYIAAERQGWLTAPADLIPESLRTKPEVRVTSVIVETGRSADAVVVASGYLESYRQANIGARAAGRIQSVDVEEGTKVKTGQVIAMLEHRDIEAALAAAEASLAQAQAQVKEQEVEVERSAKDVKRNEGLRASNALSEAEFDKIYFQHQSAMAKLATLRAAVQLAEAKVLENQQFKENMIVRAPFDGTVISKDAEVGESILPGGMGEASGRGSVVTIADLERLEVDCDVKEDYIGRVTNDSPAEVVVGAVPNRRYAAKVRKVIPMGDRARATIKVKVSILDADARLFPEMSATVYFLPKPGAEAAESKERRVFCDAAAVVTTNSGTGGAESFVWTVDDGLKTARRTIKVGMKRDTRIEITEGLVGGERVVVGPPADLQAGQAVKLRE